MTNPARQFQYTIAISISQIIEIPDDASDPVAAVLADPAHKAIVDGLRGRVEAVRMDYPDRNVTMVIRDVVVASEEWTA